MVSLWALGLAAAFIAAAVVLIWGMNRAAAEIGRNLARRRRGTGRTLGDAAGSLETAAVIGACVCFLMLSTTIVGGVLLGLVLGAGVIVSLVLVVRSGSRIAKTWAAQKAQRTI